MSLMGIHTGIPFDLHRVGAGGVVYRVGAKGWSRQIPKVRTPDAWLVLHYSLSGERGGHWQPEHNQNIKSFP